MDIHTIRMELRTKMRYAIAVATFVVSFIPCVLYDRHARKKELLTYQIMRLF